MKRNPRSRYVRMKQARKECPCCGSADVLAFNDFVGGMSFECRRCFAIKFSDELTWYPVMIQKARA